jgi:hypothetical protein
MRADEHYSATRLASGAGQQLYVAKLRDLDAKECVIACIWGAGATLHMLCWLSDRGAFTPSLGTYIVNALAAASISGSVKTQRR